MATNSICVIVTKKGGLFVGQEDEIKPLITGQEIKKRKWKDLPRDTEAFIRENPSEKENLLKALHYWALCALGKLEYDENKYGLIKRKLSKFGKKLYRRVRNFAKSIAAEFRRAFPKPKKQAKMEQQFFAFVKQHWIA